MKPELTLSDLKIASFTADEYITIKIALNNNQRALQRLSFIEKHSEQIYRLELSQAQQALEVFSAALHRDP
jgi:hypothetical protein